MWRELARGHRGKLNQLLRDGQVTLEVDRAVTSCSQLRGKEQALEHVAKLLVDACWMSTALTQSSARTDPAKPVKSSRSKNLKELLAAAETASLLTKRTATLTDTTLTVAHLMARVKSGLPLLYVDKRRGWSQLVPGTTSPHISVLLEALAHELVEEASILKQSIESKRQISSSRQSANLLIDGLLRESMKLGATNAKGQSAPDFKLVHALVTSLLPELPLDISTARKRWATRQGKVAPKAP
jgi:hypothetical protein